MTGVDDAHGGESSALPGLKEVKLKVYKKQGT